jgi:hypothetical protein
MDINCIIEALRSTTIAEGQSQASDYLKKVHFLTLIKFILAMPINLKVSSVIGFPQVLLHVIQNEKLDCSIRQAAVIYLKNAIYEHWNIDKDENSAEKWELSEQDKAPLKQQIIPAIIHAPEPIKFIYRFNPIPSKSAFTESIYAVQYKV